MLRHLLLGLLVIAASQLADAQFAYGQQPVNEIEIIKKEVAELQELVREIEGRLFQLQQRLKRLPSGNTAIDMNADLLKRIFNQLNALRQTKKLQKVKINVTVQAAGVVVLKGEVPNTDQMKLVLETVRKVPGVKTIVNQIKVGKPEPDETITSRSFYLDDSPPSWFISPQSTRSYYLDDAFPSWFIPKQNSVRIER